MPYSTHYALADGCIAHLTTVVPAIGDPLVRGQYAGFASVIGVTVYELAIKEIFTEFARKKHKIFGDYIEAHFERLNGRIRLRNIKEEHALRFGVKYVDRLKRLLASEEAREFAASGRSMQTSYSNLITWRNEFAHQGRAPTNATFQEVCDAYNLGKIVVECIAKAMVR